MANNYKFNLLTIPHSGSRFLMQYFSACEFYNPSLEQDVTMRKKENAHYFLNHFTANWTDSNTNLFGATTTGYPTISTLQHPYRTAVSWFSRGKDINELLASWDAFIKYTRSRPVIYFDLNCPEEQRVAHLLNILRQAKVYNDTHIETTETYVMKWKIIGAQNTDIKAAYLHNGTLPAYNWPRFDRAVNWYNKQKTKCVY